VLLGIIAILIQVFGVQTHIHTRQPQADFRITDVIVGTVLVMNLDRTPIAEVTTTPQAKYPTDDGTANCPLCQEFAHFGKFIQGLNPLAGLPFLVSLCLVVFADIDVSPFVVSHSWQGRAPPRKISTGL
jgi:hypothetical protein